MSLAQYKATKRYIDRHRNEHREACKRYYQKNKESELKACHKRTRKITEGARRWRKKVGPHYWGLKHNGFG